MNPTEATKAAGYTCKDPTHYSQLGYKIRKRLEPVIEKWLEDSGLSDNALKCRLLSLMQARETRLISVKGALIDQLDGVKTVAASSQTKVAGDGTSYNEEHTVIGVDVENLTIQLKATETVCKMRGLLKENVNVTGMEGLAEAIMAGRKRAGVDDDE